VNQSNAVDFIRAGAVALGIGKDLIHQDAIRRASAVLDYRVGAPLHEDVAEARSIGKEARS